MLVYQRVYTTNWCDVFHSIWGHFGEPAFPSPALQLSQLLRPSCGDIWVSVMLGKRTRFIHRSIILLPIWLFLGDFRGKPTVSYRFTHIQILCVHSSLRQKSTLLSHDHIPIYSHHVPLVFPIFSLKNGWLLMVLADTPPCQGAHLLWFWPRQGWLRVGGFTFYRFIHVSYVSLMCKDLRILFFFLVMIEKG